MNKKLIIVEDEVYLADMYKTQFELAGYQVIIAKDGQEGIELIERHLPDVVLLDLKMPKMDGFKVLEQLRKNDKTKNILVCILSNLGQRHEVKQGLAAGADGYYVKSNISPRELQMRIDRLLSID